MHYQMGVLLPGLNTFTKVGEIYCQTEVSMLAFNSVVPVPSRTQVHMKQLALPPPRALAQRSLMTALFT